METAVLIVLAIVVIAGIGGGVYYYMSSSSTEEAEKESNKKDAEADKAAEEARQKKEEADAAALKAEEEKSEQSAIEARLKEVEAAKAAEAARIKDEEAAKARERLMRIKADALPILKPKYAGCYFKFDPSCKITEKDSWMANSQGAWTLDALTAPGHPAKIFNSNKEECETGIVNKNFKAVCPNVQTKWLEKGDDLPDYVPGCYLTTPSGCPKLPSDYTDKYGKHNYIYNRVGGNTWESCEKLVQTVNNTCGVSDSDTVFLPNV